MAAINWTQTQKNLMTAGFNPNGIDGIPGRGTISALLRFMGPSAKPEVLKEMASAIVINGPRFGAFDSRERLADFVPQTTNETGGYTRFEESLAYSPKRMTEVWPSRIPNLAAAQPYVGQPVKLANFVYGDRMGNRPGTNDGWDFRGSGPLQLTGRGNWEASEKSLGLGLTEHPELARLPGVGMLIALDFYTRNGVWAAIDAGDTTKARRITNGGSVGLAEVNRLRAKILIVLA